MGTEKDSYRQIFKSTSIFGGLQVFNIVISVVKSKIVAVLLGPAGLGIISIFTSTSNLIASFTGLGINVAAVKSIASANQTDDLNNQSVIIAVIKKMIWLTGLLGFLVTVILSPWLSKISFGDSTYTFSFALLGLSLLALQMSNGQNAILQGLRQVKLIALSSLAGAVLGFFLTIPLYYFFGKDGIVPAIVATSMLAVLTSWYFLRKANIPNIKISFSTLKKEGQEIFRLGFLISLTSIFPSMVAYGIRLYISNVGNIEDVGLFTAGFAIVGTYVGMVFAAMGTDYYPSLAQVANNNAACAEKVNQQILVSILILAPILIVLIVFIKIGVIILYSSKFIGIVKMIQWAALGVIFQALSWCIAFIFLAKGDTKLFFWNELIPNIYTLILNCISYKIWGLEGMGISFLVGYFLYFVQVYIIAKKKYSFHLDTAVAKICLIQFLIMLISFTLVYYLKPSIGYTVGVFLTIISLYLSVKTLDNKTQMISSITIKAKKLKAKLFKN